MTPEAPGIAVSRCPQRPGGLPATRRSPTRKSEADRRVSRCRGAAAAARSTISGAIASRMSTGSARELRLVAGTATCGHVLQYPLGQRGAWDETSHSRQWATGCWAGSAGLQSHPELDLVIRIHPAEVGLRNHPTRERMADHISAHVRTSCHRTSASSRPTIRRARTSFMDEASLGLVYTSTVGLELAVRGVPVIVAADTHYRGRGFTVDPGTASEYWSAADRLMSTPPDGDERARLRELARRYAALFFFRFHNVLAAVTEDGRSRPRIRVSDAKDLDAGNDPALDRLVAGILYGTSVVAPASRSSAPSGLPGDPIAHP